MNEGQANNKLGELLSAWPYGEMLKPMRGISHCFGHVRGIAGKSAYTWLSDLDAR